MRFSIDKKMENKGVTIGNKVENCEVEDGIQNNGKIKVQTDGKTNFYLGDVITNTKANSITHKTKIEQTLATPTSSRLVEGISGNPAQVIIINRIEMREVKKNVASKGEVFYQRDDRNYIDDEHDEVKPKRFKFDQTINQR